MVDDSEWRGNWSVAVDLANEQCRLPIETTRRPDLAIYCSERKVLKCFELTVCWETGMEVACTKPYYLDVADDSRVCYVEKDFLSKVICKKLHDEVQCLHYDVLK